MLRGKAGMGRGGTEKPSKEEVVDLEIKLPADWESGLDLPSDKTFLTPHHHQATQEGHQDLNLPPTASTADAVTTTYAFYTLDMVRNALERAAAARSTTSLDTSSSLLASTSSSSSFLGKRNCSPPSRTAPPPVNPAIRTYVCPSCFTHVLIIEAKPWCPRCGSKEPPLPSIPIAHNSRKKPRIDLNADADETE
ncbi:uncharacterized protein LOC119368351 [Triticum dicoccoides]|uniref:uncharacterized protein LOC119368351 n=1 Tax=Triticum dicoccoides TaxID=85692 RepID=UPI00188EFF38|nr:uncharacterized protein LOC119368351 [Triticum dicoccoides]